MFRNKSGSSFVLLVLCALGLLAYGRTLGYPFVHDDVVFIQQNPGITRFDWAEIFSGGQATPAPALNRNRFRAVQGVAPPNNKGATAFSPWGSTSSQVINVYYRPLLEVFYRIQYFFFGLNPAGYHFFNIFVHIANSFLVYVLFSFLDGKRRGIAFAAAILFLLHPVQSEAVACISGISNLLFAFWILAGLCLYLRWRQDGKRGWHVLSLASFLFGLLAKEQAVMLPVLILGWLWGEQDKRGTKKWADIAGYFCVLTAYFLARNFLVTQGALPGIAFNYELLLRVLSIPRTVLMYLGIIVSPHDLHYYRSIDILQPNGISWALLLLLLTAIFAIIRRVPAPEKRLLVLGAGWFGITLLPVLNIVPLINEYSLILTAEHFLYLPLVGALLFGLGFARSVLGRWQGKRRMLLGVGGMCLLIIFSLAATIRQNTFWAGEVPLFERTVRFEKTFGRAHLLLANAYYAQGDYLRAIETYRRALAIMDGYLVKVGPQPVAAVYLGFIKEIHFGLARCFEALGDSRQASEAYLRALAAQENLEKLLRGLEPQGK